jgi:hypothetical protein
MPISIKWNNRHDGDDDDSINTIVLNDKHNNIATNTTTTTVPIGQEQRDLELENVIGNLMIAEYQLDRLKVKLAEKLAGYGRGVAGYHYKSDKKPISINVFEHKGKWFRVSLKVDELSLDKAEV